MFCYPQQKDNPLYLPLYTLIVIYNKNCMSLEKEKINSLH